MRHHTQRIAAGFVTACAFAAVVDHDRRPGSFRKRDHRRQLRCRATWYRSARPCSTRPADDAKNWLHSNGSYEQSRYYTGSADQRRQRRQAQAGVRVPDGGAGVDGDRADRDQRRDVPDHVVQPRLCHRRDDRRRILALQAQARTDRHGVLRQQQPRRRGVRRQAVHGHDRRQAGRARRQDRQAALGDSRSPIRKKATRKRWRRRTSTARC